MPAGEGALGGAVRRASPVRLTGEIKAASYHLDGRRPGALLAVPLVDRRGGHVRGVLLADRFADRPFTDEDERLLVTLASEILRAVASERLMEDLKQTRDEKEKFFQAIERLNRATKLDEVTEVSIEVARAMVDGDRLRRGHPGRARRRRRSATGWPGPGARRPGRPRRSTGSPSATRPGAW